MSTVANLYSNSFAFYTNSSSINESSDTISIANANTYLSANDQIKYIVPDGSSPISGLDSNNAYYVTFANSSSIALSLTKSGPNVSISPTEENDTNYIYKFSNTNALTLAPDGTISFAVFDSANDLNVSYSSTKIKISHDSDDPLVVANSSSNVLVVKANGNVLISKGIIANNSLGSANQVLTSNGSGVYWSSSTSGGGNGTVTSVASGNGLSGGPITTTGTLSVLANTGIVANATGVYVNSAYIGTLSANNTTYVNGKTEGNLNVNNSTTVGGNTASTLRTYSETTASNAYTNAVSYVDGKSYVNTSQLSSNLSNYQTTAGLASNVATLSANNADYLDGQHGSYYTNATNISTGTLAEARLPYRMNQNVTTSNDVTFGSLTLTGNLTVSGNVTVIGANNLSVVDNMIYLNSNNTIDNEDIGIVGNYNTTGNSLGYAHTGIFRDASDGYWKVFDGYKPEPDANVNIDTSNTTFQLANFQANLYAAGNTSTNWFVANTSGAYHTGTINAASHTVGTSFTANSTMTNTVSLVVSTNTATIGTGTYFVSNGNVGINTNTPAYKLEVNGTTYLRDMLVLGATQPASNLEGAEIAWVAGNTTYQNWRTDVYGYNFRIYTSPTEAKANGQVLINSANASFKVGLYVQGNTGIGNSSPAHLLRVEGTASVVSNLSIESTGNLILVSNAGISANGSLGTAGEVLHSNGSATYWAADDQGVTSVTAGNGLSGNITSTGTISVQANNGLSANSTGLFVIPGNGIIASNSTGLHVGQGTGVTVNSTTVAVNSAYIATISANNATFVNGNNFTTAIESLRANRNISGGGTITVDASGNVLWSTRFIVISNGRGTNFATAGYWDIICPTSGTITGVGGAANVTATASGIPLAAWTALYYILPVGSSNGPVAANFRVVTYFTDLDIPPDWVLICIRNSDYTNNKFYFNNGIILEPGQNYVGASHTSVAIGSNTFTVGTGTYFVANGNVGVGNSVPTSKLSVNGTTYFQANVTLNSGLIANGSIGTAGQVLHSNGTATYWANDDISGSNGTVTSVASGNGLTGGPITTTGTLSVLANTGIIANATGLYVNSSYIEALSSNNASYVQRYGIPNTGAASGWVNLGTFACSQDGDVLKIKIYATTGYNADINQNQITEIFFKTSNGISNTAGFLGDAYAHTFGPQTNSPTTIRIVQASTTSYVVHANFATYSGTSFYEIAHNGTSWTHSGTNNGATAPTGTYIDVTKYKIWTELSDGAGSGLDADLLDGQQGAYYTNATNITTGTLPYAQIPANVINTTAAFTRSGITTFSANIVLGSSGLSSNGSFGTAGHVLYSNGSATYWAAGGGTITSISTGNGLTGGPISSSGTISALANTGIVANATGLYVNASYIATIASNSANYANGSISNTFTVGTGTYFVSNGNVGIGTNAPSQKLHVLGTGFASSDFRAPIFYDSDDTGYYVNPNSTSKFLDIWTNSGYIYFQTTQHKRITSNDGGGNWNFRAGNYMNTTLQYINNGANSGAATLSFTCDGTDGYISLLCAPIGVAGANVSYTGSAGLDRYGTFGASGDLRAPRYYDSDNTAYYIDGAGASVLTRISLFSGTTSALHVNDVSGAASFNYIMSAANDTGNKLVAFVNGSTRNTDGGNNAVTFRNDGGPFVLGSASYATTVTGSTVTVPTDLIVSGGVDAIQFNNATSNYMLWNSAGVAAPAFTTRSAGTKLVLFPAIGASSVDYGLGIENNTLWFSTTTTSTQFKWYGGTTLAMTLSGAGQLTLVNNQIVNLASTSLATFSTASTASEGQLIANFTGQNSAYLFNNGTAWGLYSASGGGIISYSRSNNRADLGAAYTQAAGSLRAPIFYDSDDTIVRWDAGIFVLRSASPTIYFRDTDHNSAMLHCNSNTFYILRGGNDTETATQVNSQWPFYISLANNDAVFGGAVSTIGAMYSPIYYDRDNTAYYVNGAGTSIFNQIDYALINGPATNSRDKIRLWSAAPYSIGMTNAFTFGGIVNEYAMTFQMNDAATRGFWWGDNAHTTAQGAMALTTDGKLTVAHSIRAGYGEGDTTVPGATYRLDVSGSGYFSGNLTVAGTGSKTLIATLTASNSATISTTALSGYRYYEIIFTNIVPVTTSTILELRWYSSAAYQTTGYQNYLAIFNGGGSAAYTPTTYVDLSGGGRVSNTASNGFTGRVLLSNADQATGFKQYIIDSGGLDSSVANYCRCWGTGQLNVTAAITGFQMFMSSGNISTGRVEVWGWN